MFFYKCRRCPHPLFVFAMFYYYYYYYYCYYYYYVFVVSVVGSACLPLASRLLLVAVERCAKSCVHS